MKKLAVITVTRNYPVLADFFESLEKQKNKNFKLFLVDNSDVKEKVSLQNFDGEVIASENRGYAHAVNKGLQRAVSQGFEHFCVINDDTFFKENFIDKVVLALEKNPKSVIGGKIYYAPGFEYHKNRYRESDKGRVLWYAGGEVEWDHALTTHRGVDQVDRGQFDLFEKTEFITGCLICFDKSVLEEVGYWDESYFLYFEDADFCERAKRNGVTLFYDPSIVIYHKVSQSTGGAGSSLHQKYQSKNQVRFGLKFAPFKTKLHLIKNYLFKGFK